MEQDLKQYKKANLSKEPGYIDEQISHNIQNLRILKNIPFEDIAFKIGVNYHTYFRYEAAIERISAGSLYLISEMMRVDIEKFFEKAEVIHSNVSLISIYKDQYKENNGRKVRKFSKLSSRYASKEIDEIIAINLKKKRIARGLPRTALASELGINRTAYERYENCTGRISAGNLYIISKLYNCNIKDLFAKDVYPSKIKQNSKLGNDKIFESKFARANQKVRREIMNLLKHV